MMLRFFFLILALIPTLSNSQGSIIMSGTFDIDTPVRIVAVSTADTSNCTDLYRGTHRTSYTFKIPNMPGTTIFFCIEGKTKRMHIPHMAGDAEYFGYVDVLFKKKSDYLIYQSQPKRKSVEEILH